MRVRKTLLAKTGGRCAYCGCVLDGRWQRDHVEPLVRYRNVRWTFSGRTGCKYPERHRPDNLVAACMDCNRSKGAMDLETWRGTLRWLGWRKGVVFYFEKRAKQP